MLNFIKTIIRKAKENKNRPKVKFKIKFDNTGLSVEPIGEPYGLKKKELLWKDVKKVLVCKRDLFAYDQICLYFELSDSGVEINENMEEWTELINSLPEYLPGCKNVDDWWSEVVYPAFKTNLTEIISVKMKQK
jgi:hypothetical protein